MKHPFFFGAMMVREGMADGSVAGSLSTTGDVIRAGIQIVGMPAGITVVSSFFLMVFPHNLFICRLRSGTGSNSRTTCRYCNFNSRESSKADR